MFSDQSYRMLANGRANPLEQKDSAKEIRRLTEQLRVAREAIEGLLETCDSEPPCSCAYVAEDNAKKALAAITVSEKSNG